jgi:glyoxylase-like metal-dependent hydrolase (beta-lactamase superfamily II)
MDYKKSLNNVYLIDAKMFGFAHYMSSYLVKGKEIALVDTGLATQVETVRGSIKAHGFSVKDISYIFITHAHPDHYGAVAALLKENTIAKVYIHPLGVAELADPSIDAAVRKVALPPKMAARFEGIEAVPISRIQPLKDGDTYDLGNGENLKVIFAPGHQPSGIVIWEEKNKGLFINDLVGNYLPDVKAHYTLNPPNSDHQQAIKSLNILLSLPIENLYLGHYGIVSDNPKKVMTDAIANMQKLLDIGSKYMRQGQPEKIADEVYQLILPQLEKLRTRGEEIYQYATGEHVSSQAKLFAKYCQQKMK